MSKRTKKIAVLAVTGGVLFQAVGCSTLLTQQIVQLVFSQVLSAVIQSILNSGTVA